MAAGITILNPGLLTTVQDAGRIGYQAYGVSVSGVMDPRAMNARQPPRSPVKRRVWPACTFTAR